MTSVIKTPIGSVDNSKKEISVFLNAMFRRILMSKKREKSKSEFWAEIAMGSTDNMKNADILIKK